MLLSFKNMFMLNTYTHVTILTMSDWWLLRDSQLCFSSPLHLSWLALEELCSRICWLGNLTLFSHFFFYILFTLRVYMGVCMPWHTCRGQRTTCRNQFSLSAMWAVGSKLRLVMRLGSLCLYCLAVLIELRRLLVEGDEIQKLTWQPRFCLDNLVFSCNENLMIL